MRRVSHTLARRDRGFALLETLLVMCISGTAVLGLLWLLLQSVNQHNSAVLRERAEREVADRAEWLLAQPAMAGGESPFESDDSQWAWPTVQWNESDQTPSTSLSVPLPPPAGAGP